MRAVRFSQTGGPEVLELVEVPTPAPGPGEILIRHEAIGLNFIEIYQRSGLYPMPLPSGLGQEAAGVVEAVGEGVTRFEVGDRAGYCTGSSGSYAEASVVKAERAVKIPEAVPSKVAAAQMLRGMTAEYLIRRAWPVKAGDTVLIHAAAGGLGIILTQWAKHLGVRVIATVGSEAKAAVAKRFGADEIVFYDHEDVALRVRELTGGKGVPVVYDGVGRATFEGSLASLSRRGCLVAFGNASGAADPLNIGRLSRMGSLYVTRPTLNDYVATTEELDDSAGALFGLIAAGKIKVEIGSERPLDQVRQAHEEMEARRTVGANILIP
jgi:NADPH2:quinone reductase